VPPFSPLPPALLRHMNAALAVALLATPLGACNDHSTNPVERAAFVYAPKLCSRRTDRLRSR